MLAAGFGLAERIPTVDRSFTLVQSDAVTKAQSTYRLLDTLGTWLPFVILGLRRGRGALARDRSRALIRESGHHRRDGPRGCGARRRSRSRSTPRPPASSPPRPTSRSSTHSCSTCAPACGEGAPPPARVLSHGRVRAETRPVRCRHSGGSSCALRCQLTWTAPNTTRAITPTRVSPASIWIVVTARADCETAVMSPNPTVVNTVTV